MPDFDIAVVGGGAAGLSAAIFAAQAAADAGRPVRVAVLDGTKRLGAKILVSGGGRCNVTHHAVTAGDYHGPKNVVNRVLRAFGVDDTIAWFADMGVTLKREPTGKLFPTTDAARTVLDALLHRCDRLGVRLLTAHRVAAVEKVPDTFFRVEGDAGVVTASRVVLATGGRSLPKTGSDGQGYALARSLGHTVTPTYPALVPLVLDGPGFDAALSGVSHEAELSTFVEGRRVDRRAGSLLWTHFGISGPVAMDASRAWTTATGEGRPAEVRASLLPGETFDTVDAALAAAGSQDGKRSVGRWLAEAALPAKVAAAVADHAGLDPGLPLARLPRGTRRSLTHALTALPLPVHRDRGWNYAEVTAGGVPVAEVDPRTMASRRCDGLHLVGEILDVDGRIGGFNFQWAWATGHLAGVAAARACFETADERG